MFRKRRTQTVEFDLNLAPLVDVMMCLIIFFMLTARLAQREHARVDLPKSTTAQPDPREPAARRVVVNVTDAGGAALYQVGDRPLGLDSLGERLAVEAARDPGVTCYIRADRRLEYRHVEPILLQCSRARIGRVTFATTAGLDGGLR